MKTFDYQDEASTAIVEGIKAYAGISEPVEPPVIAQHWAKQYLDALQAKGLITNPDEWEDFDSPGNQRTGIGALRKNWQTVCNRRLPAFGRNK